MTTELPLDELSLVFARVRGLLLTEETVEHAVELLAQAAKTTVPAAIGAGVTVISSSGGKGSAGSTDRVVREADDLQYESGEGPCLTAWSAQKAVNVEDVRGDLRWPKWSAAVVGLPIQSVVSVPMLHNDKALGALKVYSATSHAFSDETVRLLTLFAGPAALAHVQTQELPVQLSETLQNALSSRDTINMAKGVLMARNGSDAEAATGRLIRLARAERRTLLETAQALISTGVPQTGQAQ